MSFEVIFTNVYYLLFLFNFFFFNEDLFVGLRPRLNVYTSKFDLTILRPFQEHQEYRCSLPCLVCLPIAECGVAMIVNCKCMNNPLKPPRKCHYCFSSFLFFPILFFLSPPSSFFLCQMCH